MFKRITAAVATALLAGAAIAGATGASASTTANRPVNISGDGWTCTYSSPEYMVHAGGADVQTKRGQAAFTAEYAGRAGHAYEDPYLTLGYNMSLNSGFYCDGDHRAFTPPNYAHLGNPVVSYHDVTSNMAGDTGLDIWFEPHVADDTYKLMTGQGSASTEIMVWSSHPHLGTQSSSLRYYPVVIGGNHYQIAVGLASRGHGRSGSSAGWNVVDFIAPNIGTQTRVNNLKLNPLFAYAVKHGWLKSSDYLMAIDQGGEMTRGHISVDSYSLSGLR